MSKKTNAEFVPRCPGCGRPYGWTRLIRRTLCDVCLIRKMNR